MGMTTLERMPAIDLEALTLAMALAPGVYARNRHFALFKQHPEVARARARAAVLRGLVRQLSGAHGKLACESCHRRPPDEVKLKQDCLSCHSKDDVHIGQYGRQCDRCHTTVTWKGARVQ